MNKWRSRSSSERGSADMSKCDHDVLDTFDRFLYLFFGSLFALMVVLAVLKHLETTAAMKAGLVQKVVQTESDTHIIWTRPDAPAQPIEKP